MMLLTDSKDTTYAIREVLDDHPVIAAALSPADRHHLAERLADEAVRAVDKAGQATRHVVLDTLGNAHCSWCGRMGCSDGTSPLMSPLHPQYGLFCTCTEPRVTTDEPNG